MGECSRGWGDTVSSGYPGIRHRCDPKTGCHAKGCSWEVRIELGSIGGKRLRHYETVTGKRRAIARRAELLTLRDRGELVASDGRTVTELAVAYMNAVGGDWKGGTLTRRRADLDLFGFVGDIQAAKLKPVEVERRYREIRDAGLSVSTVLSVHSLLKGMYRWAHRLNVVGINPMDRVSPPKKEAAPVEIPPKEELRAMLDDDVPGLMWRTYLKVAMFTGARPGELVALRWSDFDFDKEKVRIGRTVTSAPSGIEVRDGTKAGGARVVDVAPSVVAQLGRWREQSSHEATALELTSAPGEDWVFWSYREGRAVRFTPQMMSVAWHGQRDRLGLPRRKPYVLRHYYASAQLAAGVDPVKVAAQLGHSAQMLLKTYAHVISSEGNLGANIEAMLD